MGIHSRPLWAAITVAVGAAVAVGTATAVYAAVDDSVKGEVSTTLDFTVAGQVHVDVTRTTCRASPHTAGHPSRIPLVCCTRGDLASISQTSTGTTRRLSTDTPVPTCRTCGRRRGATASPVRHRRSGRPGGSSTPTPRVTVIGCDTTVPSPTPTESVTPIVEETVTPTASATAWPTASATASPTASATASPTASATALPTASATASPTTSAAASPGVTTTGVATATTSLAHTGADAGSLRGIAGIGAVLAAAGVLGMLHRRQRTQ